jgi:hypothetical protein
VDNFFLGYLDCRRSHRSPHSHYTFTGHFSPKHPSVSLDLVGTSVHKSHTCFMQTSAHVQSTEPLEMAMAQ